jgi:hypothetical protein
MLNKGIRPVAGRVKPDGQVGLLMIFFQRFIATNVSKF